LAPRSEQELLTTAEALSGRTLGELAAEAGLAVPEGLLRAKGWVGQLMERRLGATASSRAEPDFQHLGVELKTLPVDGRGRPVESTFVCTIHLEAITEVEWSESLVYRKLRRVLWVPVEGSRSIPVAHRRVGAPLLWSPNAQEQAALRADWEDLVGMIGRGQAENITGHFGRFLQVRPKAAHSRVLRRTTDLLGDPVDLPPRGFYLRSAFTSAILRQHFSAVSFAEPGV